MEKIIPAHLILLASKPLIEATDKLLAAADEAGESTGPERANYLDALLFKQLEGEIDDLICAGGQHQGPNFNAVQGSGTWLRRAIGCHYRVDDGSVKKKFVSFLKMEATAGWLDRDANGTQIGNFLADWRGGGL